MKLALLPGLDGTGLLFKPLLDVLSKDIDTLVISYPHDVLMGYDELLEYVAAQLPKENYVLLAESFAGPLAYKLAQHQSAYLKSIIFVATFLDSPRPFLSRLSENISPKFIPIIPDFILKKFVIGRTANEEVVSLFRESVPKVSPEVLSFRLKELSNLSAIRDCGQVELKVIYIQAIQDNLVLEKSIDSFKQIFSKLDIFKVKGSHFVLQTNPQACANIIENHFAAIRK